MPYESWRRRKSRTRGGAALWAVLAGTACWGEAVERDAGEGSTTGLSLGSTTEALTAGASPEATETGPGGECTSLQEQARELFTARCGGCHSGPAAQVFDHVAELDRLVDDGKVRAGDPGASPLYKLVDADLMPKGGPPLTKSEKATIHAWISLCTGQDAREPLGPPQCTSNLMVPPEEMVEAMVENVSVSGANSPFLRFATLTHLHNAGYCSDQLDVYRHALTKVLNSLSSSNRIVRPTPIDPARTIYRIDLRDYGWDADLWEHLVLSNPFAVEYLFSAAEPLKDATGSRVPSQMADWLVVDAATAPLYDQILYERVFNVIADISSPTDPLTRFDLEEFLGIDLEGRIAQEIAQNTERVMRAGFQDSGVSSQNRVIERHELAGSVLPEAPYWISYDFLDDTEIGDIFAHPLDFVADGGEVIWTLPNGLQAYLLVDGEGVRVDKADVEIVSNKEQAGEPIVNGISCMGCHSEGMRMAVDEVGPYVIDSIGSFDDVEKEEVSRLYTLPDLLTAALERDRGRFVSQMGETGGPLEIAGEEAVSAAFTGFVEQRIDLRRMAAELGVTADALAPNVGLLPEGLKKVDGGTVTRSAMRADFGEAVCRLKLGITAACKPTG